MIPKIAIIGRPNVGKSSIFNRILSQKVAVVDDIAGVTRDRNYRPFSWNGRKLMLVDTGGMMPTEKTAMPKAVHEQILIAVDEAAVVLFIVDGRCGVTSDDLLIAKTIRKTADGRIILLVNKCDSAKPRREIDEYRALGLGDPFPVSAIHGMGIADTLDNAVELCKKRGAFDKVEPKPPPIDLRLAIVGRPNAGKSSLVNKLLNKERMIVHDIPGTTRDSIDSELRFGDRRVLLIDTAGLRKKSHVKHGLEYFFNLRTIESLERCDVVALVVDIENGIGIQDLRIVTKALELRKGVLVVLNKWDLCKKDHKTFDRLVCELRGRFLELRTVPFVSISALTGQRVTVVLDRAFDIKERMTVRVPSAGFEDTLFGWVRTNPHPALPSDPIRFLGAKQVSAPFPMFRFFVTNPKKIVESYSRFLTNKIYETYGFEGCPMVLEFRPARKTTSIETHKEGS